MTLSLRSRLLLMVLPFVVLLAGLGTASVVLMYWVSNRIDVFLRENDDSIRAMVGLGHTVHRLDALFCQALLQRDRTRSEYRQLWKNYWQDLEAEQHNITIPGEGELVAELTGLSTSYQAACNHYVKAIGDDKYLKGGNAERCFGTSNQQGLLQQSQQIQEVIEKIRVLNEGELKRTSRAAHDMASMARTWLVGGLLACTLVGLGLAFYIPTCIVGPLHSVISSVEAIRAGNLNQLVPVEGKDEIGQLARVFNRMILQLRDYRQSHSSRLLRAQRTSQATIDAFPDPVLVVEPSGRVEMANPAARKLLGFAPPPAFPADHGSSSPEAEKSPGQAWRPPSALQGPLHEALERQRPFFSEAYDQAISFLEGDDDRAFLPQVLPIQDPYGNTLGAAVVLNDVTRFRLLDQIKTDLVATVSHELKTPLTSVRLVLHLLLEETVGPLTPKQTELLVDARDNAERLLKMIEHLLALARLEKSQDALTLQAESPIDLLRVAAHALAPRAEAKHVEVVVQEAPDLPLVAVDPVRLGHVLNNLLDNALTYTESPGRITLSAERDGEDRVRLSVADTGIGIPPQYLPHVFDKFFRVPGQSMGTGTGLGLAIVREIVTAHRGEITCQSEPGRGTVFQLTLPAWEGLPRKSPHVTELDQQD